MKGKLRILLVLCLGIISAMLVTGVAEAKVVATVDYLEEEITASTSGSAIYVSTDKEKSWDRLEDTFVSGGHLTVRMDISTILSSKPVKVYFRSNLLDTSDEVELQGLSSIKGKYGMNTSGASITITQIPDGRVVEYRKGNASTWKSITGNTSKTTVSAGTATLMVNEYTLKGATFTFRLKAAANQRVGKEIKVKVGKKANAPNAKVDGSKLMITGLSQGKAEYRTTLNGAFTKVDKKAVYQSEIFGVSAASVKVSGTGLTISQAGVTVPMRGGTLELRTAQTDKKPASRSKNVIVMPQSEFTDSSKVKVEAVLYKNTTGCAITISDASKDKAYEYTLVAAKSTTVDLEKTKWVAVTKGTALQIKKTNNIEPSASGTILLVRLKSTTDKNTKVVTPASTCYQVLLPNIQ